MRHEVRDEDLRAVAHTRPEPPAAGRLLTAGQHSKRLLLLRAVVDAAHARHPWPGSLPERLDGYWKVLAAAERTDPEAVRRVLLYPTVGGWAELCLRRLHGVDPAPAGSRGPDGEPFGELEHLGAIAAAAALRAGLPFDLEVGPRDGVLPLPSLGAVSVPGRKPVRVAGTETGVRVEAAGGEQPVTVRRGWRPGSWKSPDPRWLPLHPLPGSAAVIDDLDPFRDPLDGIGPAARRPAGRLTAAGRLCWQKLWRSATALLERVDPARAAEVQALVRCVVPLAGDTGATMASATLRAAFGAVYTTLPPAPSDLAATLVHELAHNKLAALLDLAPLHHDGHRPRHWAPWRPDPRPLEGLLQGAYAHLALADYWQRAALAATGQPEREAAWAEQALRQEQVGAVLPALARAGELTDQGRTFVAGMAEAHAALARHPAPAPHRRAAAGKVAGDRARFAAAHGEPTPG
jgi:HEXXH motif-containing protein